MIAKQVERGVTVYLSGLREKYFGEVFLNASTSLGDFHFSATSNTFLEESRSNFLDLLETNESVVRDLGNSWSFETKFSNKSRYERASFEAGLNHIARYVESFESQSNEVWLVFRHEGISLSKLMYTVEEVEISPEEEKTEKVKEAQVLRPSKWWHWLKTTEAGQDEMRNLIWQLVCLRANFSLCQTVSETLVINFQIFCFILDSCVNRYLAWINRMAFISIFFGFAISLTMHPFSIWILGKKLRYLSHSIIEI